MWGHTSLSESCKKIHRHHDFIFIHKYFTFGKVNIQNHYFSINISLIINYFSQLAKVLVLLVVMEVWSQGHEFNFEILCKLLAV